MSEIISPAQTSNGYEILNPRENLGLEEFRGMLDVYGLNGNNATERVEALRGQSKESLAVFLTDLNARLNGSEDSLINEETMKIGEKPTVAPEYRYDLFSEIVDKIKESPSDVNPERIGDTLALSTVLLHPFSDGNGRTARMLGYIFRDEIDGPEAQADFDTLARPRDETRKEGGFMINGYIPYVGEGSDQSDPAKVGNYLEKLLTSNDQGLYTGPYGQAELTRPQINNMNPVAS